MFDLSFPLLEPKEIYLAISEDTFVLNQRSYQKILTKKRLFEVFRHYHFIVSGAVTSLHWVYKNRSYFQETPLFWEKFTLIIRKIELIVGQTLDLHAPLINFYCSTTKIAQNVLSRHFLQLMQKFGTCQGQSLTIMEFLHQEPDLDPSRIHKYLFQNPERIYYHQILEIIRGFLENKLEESKKINENVNEENKLEIQKAINDCLIKPDKSIYFEFSKWNRGIAFQKIKKILLDETNATLLYRRWDEGDSCSHSILFHRSKSRNWFYNSMMIGLYVYNDIQIMVKNFIDHIHVSYPQKRNKKSYVFIEIYQAEKSTN